MFFNYNFTTSVRNVRPQGHGIHPLSYFNKKIYKAIKGLEKRRKEIRKKEFSSGLTVGSRRKSRNNVRINYEEEDKRLRISKGIEIRERNKWRRYTEYVKEKESL